MSSLDSHVVRVSVLSDTVLLRRTPTTGAHDHRTPTGRRQNPGGGGHVCGRLRRIPPDQTVVCSIWWIVAGIAAGGTGGLIRKPCACRHPSERSTWSCAML